MASLNTWLNAVRAELDSSAGCGAEYLENYRKELVELWKAGLSVVGAVTIALSW